MGLFDLLEDAKYGVERIIRNKRESKLRCKELHKYLKKIGLKDVNKELADRSFEIRSTGNFTTRWLVFFESEEIFEIIEYRDGTCVAERHGVLNQENFEVMESLEEIIIAKFHDEYIRLIEKEERESLEKKLTARAEESIKKRRMKENLKI